jgi:hypothetical protein
VLRGFGIWLVRDAISTGAAVLAAAWVFAGRTLLARHQSVRLATNLALIGLAAVAMLVLGAGCELGFRSRTGVLDGLGRAAWFLAVWSAPAAAWSVFVNGRAGPFCKWTLTALCAAVSVALAAAPVGFGVWRSAAALGLSMGACALVMVANRASGSMIRTLPCA